MKGRGEYPADWDAIAKAVKDEAGWRCVRCDHPHSVRTGHVLTVHHLDGDKGNCRWWNLAALCQRCHLKVQAKVRMEQTYLGAHSEWFRPYVAGYYAYTVLGEDLSRSEVMERMDELLAAGQPWIADADGAA